MPRRFLTLILPLLCLGIFLAGESDEGALGESEKKAQLRERSDTQLSTTETDLKKRISARARIGFHASIQELEEDVALLKSMPVFSKAALTAEAEKIWAELPDKVIIPLSSLQQDRLASFLKSSLVEVAAGDGRFICRDDSSSLEMVMAYHEVEAAVSRSTVSILARQFLGAGKWTSVASNTQNAGTQGNSVAVTWSIVPDGTLTPGLGGSVFSASNLREWLSGIYGGSATGIASEQPWFEILNSSFEAMEARSGLVFVYEPNDDGEEISRLRSGILGTRGDIRISARTLDGEGNQVDNTNTLAFAFAPNNGDVVLDSGDSFFNSTSFNSRRLFNTLAHELGHAVGLAHVCPINRTKLMEPNISLSFNGPQFDEFYSLQRQYGDAQEISNGATNNDVTARATPLELNRDGLGVLTWLSIDDNSDTDYFSFTARRFDGIEATADPSGDSYEEGPQDANCDTGEDFDAAAQQDLTIELLDQDGSTVLATANSAALGEIETLSDFVFSADGTYFLRVRGSGTNSSQLYDLALSVSGSPPLPDLSLTSHTLAAESGVVKNNRIDERETMQFALQISNIGQIATDNLTATFTAIPGVTFFTPEVTFPEIGVDETGTAQLLFAVTGQCGTDITFTAELNDGSGYQETITFTEAVGENMSTELMSESFENTTLPSGWTTTTTGAGINWVSTATAAPDGSRAAFADSVADISSATLTSPSFMLGELGSTLRFFHDYHNENRWDGSVLEASLDDGEWFDLPDSAEVTVISGDYSATMRPTSQSGLANRRAWTDDSEGFIESAFQLPGSWGGQEIRFRWILAHDAIVREDGWHIDNITLSSETGICEPHRPELGIAISESELSEGGDPASLQLTSTLPLLDPVSVILLLSGNGDATDLNGLTPLTLPAGETEISLALAAVNDASAEGPETLTLAIPADAADFAPTAAASVSLEIIDSNDYATFISNFFDTPQPAGDDSDNDGWSNLAEYLLESDPSDPSARPNLRIVLTDDTLTLPLGPLPERSDATLGVELSSDLENWNEATFTTSSTGIELPRVTEKTFLRLTFTLNP